MKTSLPIFFLLLIILFNSTSCSIAGFAIGRSVDKKRSKESFEITSKEYLKLKKGYLIKVHDPGGLNSIQGRFLRVEPILDDNSGLALIIMRNRNNNNGYKRASLNPKTPGYQELRIKFSDIGSIEVISEKRRATFIFTALGVLYDVLTVYVMVSGPNVES